MGELDRRQDWDFPVARGNLEMAERQATARIYTETNRVFLETVDHVVTEASAVKNPQTMRYVAPFVEESTRRFGRAMLEQQEASTAHVHSVANEWRRRILP